MSKQSYFRYSTLFGTILLLLMIGSCLEEKTYGPAGISGDIPNLMHPGRWITNEGGFTLGQASLSFYDYAEDKIYNNVFQEINGRPLGDVLQSINFYGGKAFLVVNNSGKIEVVDSITFESITTISGLESPREVLGYNGKLYVSDLFSKDITVLDATSYEKVSSFYSGGWTEKMIIYDNKLLAAVKQTFIENVPDARKGLMVVDLDSGEEIEFVDLPQGAGSMAVDREGMVWVLCDGGLKEETGGLFMVDPADWSVVRELFFAGPEYSASLISTDKAGDHLYFILADPDDGINAFDVMKVPVTANQLPSAPFFDGDQLYIYGFLVDEERGELLITDAVGLIQEGFFYRYNLSDLSLIRRYATGIFPGQIY